MEKPIIIISLIPNEEEWQINRSVRNIYNYVNSRKVKRNQRENNQLKKEE